MGPRYVRYGSWPCKNAIWPGRQHFVEVARSIRPHALAWSAISWHARNRDIAQNFLHPICHCEISHRNSHGTAKFILSRAASEHVKAVMTDASLSLPLPAIGTYHLVKARESSAVIVGCSMELNLVA